MSSDDKEAFWKAAGDATDPDALEQLVIETFSSKVIERRTSGQKGSYQPLGYYKKLGYDIKRIQDNCKDFTDHPLLGRSYYVDVDYRDKHRTREEIREEIVKSIQDRKASTGSGRGKSKGKGKGDGRKAQETKPDVATKKMISDSVRILAKVSPTLFSLTSIMKHRKLSLVPVPLVHKLKSHIEELQAFEKSAQKTVSSLAPLSITIASVADVSSLASQHCSVITSMLNTLSKV